MDLSFVTRKFQRSIAGLSLLAILASFAGFTGTAFAKTFSDVSSDYFAYDQIDSLSDAGVMTGLSDTTFGPDQSLTREQAAKILVLGFIGSVDDTATVTCTGTVSDWATSYVATANSWGIMNGYSDGSCGAMDSINRADFATMVARASGLTSDGTLGSDMFSDVTAGSYYDESVGTDWAYSVVDGTSSTTFSPASSVTRGQAAKMVDNAMNPVYRGTGSGSGSTGSADATVTVEVSNDTPSADTLPSGATSVELATFDLTAEGDDSMLDGLTVHQYGISSVPSGATVYLYNGTSRLTSGTTVNSTSHESDFRNLNLDLPEGDTVTVSVRMDMGTWSSTGEVGFEIASADMVDVGDSSVEGDFPAMGDKFTVSTTSAGSVTVEKNGSVDNADVGENDAYVGKFKLTASSVEGGYVQELGMYVAGTVSTADVENFRLYVTGDDSEPVAQVDNVDDLDVVRFVIGEGEGVMDGISDGYSLEKGESKSFYVLADFNTGRSSDTVSMYIDQNTDVRVVGDLYGYGMSVTRTSYDGDLCTSTAGDCTFQTLQGGDITVSSNGPAASDVAINGKDLTLLNFVVTSVTDVTFDNFPIALSGSESADTTEGLLNGTSANFTDIKIMDTDSGSQIYSSVDATSLTTTEVSSGGTAITEGAGDQNTAYYVWTDDWFVDAGSEYNLALKTDIANTSTLDAMTIIGSLPFDATFPALKDANNKTLTNSTVLVPNSTITGKTMTVKAPSLTLSLASSPAAGSTTYVKGSSDVRFSGIVFACGKASDCKVTDLTLQGYLDDDASGVPQCTAAAVGTCAQNTHSSALSTYVGSVSLVDSDGNTIAASKAVNTSTFAVTYTSLNWTIGAGDTEIAYVEGNLSSNSFANGDAETIAFGVSSASNVTVENADGNSFSATGTANSTGATYVTTSNGGSLTVAVSSSTARENIAIAGSSNVAVSAFEFTATREAFKVTDFAINNRQSAATTAALGDYDNNVASVTVSYADEDGATVSSTGFLVNGTATFSGETLWVPAGSTATMTVTATLNPITDSGSTATAGEFVDLSMAYNNFSAISQGSGSTYNAGMLDNDIAVDSDLDFGTITWTDTNALDVNLAVPALAGLGASQTLKLDNAGAATPANLPVGTLLCVTANPTCNFGTDSVLIVTGWTEGTVFTDAVDGDTVTAVVVNNVDASFANNDDVIYALPGTGFHTGTNQMVVYESKPTLTLSTSSPTSANASISEKPFYFTVSADSHEKVQIRTAQVNDATLSTTDFNDPVLNGTFTQVSATGADTLSNQGAGGIGNSGFQRETAAGADTASIAFVFDAPVASLAGYNGLSYWARASEAANTVRVTVDGAGADVVSTPSAMVANTWQFNDVPFNTAAANLATVTRLLFEVSDSTAVDTATYDIDRIVLYTEKLVVNAMASDGDIDTTAGGTDNTQGADNLVGYLYESGGALQATGYFYSAEQANDGFASAITFYPTAGTDTGIEVAANTSKTYYVQLDTTLLVDNESGVDDPIQFSINAGSSSNGVVTPGDFWWFETNALVKWLGSVTSSTLYSNALKY